jgi:hypothetical protein
MKKFTLIYFNGCPNHEPAKDLLVQAGIDFVEVCQDTIDDSDSLKGYSSPTLLMGDRIIFGSKVPGSGGGCSWKLPSLVELKDGIKSE